MHILPFQILNCVFESDLDQGAMQRLNAARAVIRCLLQNAVAAMPFDEERYMASNPDVATAIRRGEISSAREHYLAYGYFEGREGAADTFDEAWYLKRYPDVAQGVMSGQWPAGRDHYRHKGMFEWRSPNQKAESDVDRWRGMLAETMSPTAAPTN